MQDMAEDQSDQLATRRSPKGRSPSYPGISLAEAEKRVHELYAAEKKHSAPINAIVEHWGYSPSSSGGRTVFAALKKFGLLDDEGSGDERTGRLTDLGLELVLNPEAQHARRQAALIPKFHREMWDEYGENLPSPATLRYRLIREFAFTESGAQEFVEEYEATIAYAGLTDDLSVPPTAIRPEGSDTPSTSIAQPNMAVTLPSPNTANQPTMTPTGMTIPIPLLGEHPVYISGSFPLSESSWSQMIRVLEAMKPGLVNPDAGRKTNLPPTASPEPRFTGEADGGVHHTHYAPDDE